MAAPTIQTGHVTGFSTSSETTHVVNKPSTVSNGNGLYIFIADDPVGQTYALSGFTPEYSDVDISSAATCAMLRRVADGTEGSTFSVTVGISERGAWIACAVDNDGGLDVKGSTNTGTGTIATALAITTTVNDCLVFLVVCTDLVTTPFSTPSGYTKLNEVSQTSAGSVGVYYKTQATAGSVAEQTVTINVSEQWLAYQFAVKPLGGAAHNLTAIIAGLSGTSSQVLAIARALTAGVVTASATPTPSLAIARALTVGIVTASATPTTTLLIARALLAAIVGASNTSAGMLAIARALIAAMDGASNTSAIVFTGDLSLEAAIVGASNTSAGVLAVARGMAAQIVAASNTNDGGNLGLALPFSSAIIGASNTSASTLAVIRELVAAIDALSATPANALSIHRPFSAQIATSTITPVTGLVIAHNLTALLAGVSTTPAIDLDVVNVLIAGILQVTWVGKTPKIVWDS